MTMADETARRRTRVAMSAVYDTDVPGIGFRDVGVDIAEMEGGVNVSVREN